MLIIIINSMVISHVALKIISYLIVSMTIYLSPSLCQLDMCRLQFCQSLPGGCLGRAPWASNPRSGVGAVLRCRGYISAKAGLIVIVDCL